MLERFKKMFTAKKRTTSQGGGVSDEVLVANLAYQIAYYIVPSCAFDENEQQVDMCLQYEKWGEFLYFQHCQAQGINPSHSIVQEFKTDHGMLDDVRKYVVIEYPTPKTDYVTSGVLAPYFSGIIRPGGDDSIDCFVLGQSPDPEFTTFRRVSRDGVNQNLGRGPAPEREQFLAWIRGHYSVPGHLG